MRKIDDILEEGESIEEVILKGSFSFEYFFTKILGFNLAWFHREIIDLIENNKRVAIIAPRQHGKTTLICSYFLWKAFYNRDLKFLIVSDGLNQAKDNLKLIRDLILENELTKSLAPPHREKTWSKTEIETTTNCRFVVRANNEKIRGGSYDYVLCDEAGEYTDKSNFYGVILPTVIARRGTVIAIGTPKTRIDLLYGELCTPESGFAYKKYKAIMNGKPLWSWKYDLGELERMRATMPTMNWEREFMCEPISDENSLFPFRILSPNIINEPFFDKYREEYRYYIGYDVASSDAKDADASVWIVLAYNPKDGSLRIAEGHIKRGMKFSKQKEFTKELVNYWNARKVMIDYSNFGRVLYQELKDEGLPIDFYDFQKPRAREDILEELRFQFEQVGTLLIPRDRTHRRTYEFVEVLLRELMDIYPKVVETNKVKYVTVGHDDTVMALGLALLAYKGKRGRVSLQIY